MILKNNLYHILHSTQEKQYTLALNPECFIYAAHFPDKPITPGVCILQMAMELLEDIIGRSLQLHSVKSAKFLAVLSPREVKEFVVTFPSIEHEEEEVKAQTIIADSNNTVYAKLSFACQNRE